MEPHARGRRRIQEASSRIRQYKNWQCQRGHTYSGEWTDHLNLQPAGMLQFAAAPVHSQGSKPHLYRCNGENNEMIPKEIMMKRREPITAPVMLMQMIRIFELA
jgi:hypothetical protein